MRGPRGLDGAGGGSAVPSADLPYPPPPTVIPCCFGHAQGDLGPLLESLPISPQLLMGIDLQTNA